MKNSISIVDFTSYNDSIKRVLDNINADKIFSKQKKVLLKPNCVEAYKFPVTTNPECAGVIIDYIREYSDTEIIIAEGTGSKSQDTDEVFDILGFKKVADEKNIKLVDLNKEKLVKLGNKNFEVFKEYYIPEIAFESYIVSLPVLKAHSLALVTLSIKNMMGFAPPKYYQKSGMWKKSFFHDNMHNALIEMNHYRSADMIILDASVGLAEYHLGGRECTPNVKKIIAGYDSVEIDKIGTELLGMDWNKIPYINNYDNYLKN